MIRFAAGKGADSAFCEIIYAGTLKKRKYGMDFLAQILYTYFV